MLVTPSQVIVLDQISVKMAPRDKYTDPTLRDEVKEEIHQGDKGGKPGQWSARKVFFIPLIRALSVNGADSWSAGTNDGV
jgi:hypothetical protein